MAFASSTFLGATALKGNPRQVCTAPSTRVKVIRATAAQPSGRSKVWEKYQKSVTSGGPSPFTVQPEDPAASAPSQRSKVWNAFLESTRGGTKYKPSQRLSVSPAENALRAASTPFFREYAIASMRGYGSGGNARSKLQRPFTIRVDDYIADCARRQYIMTSNSSGVYAPSCTEGSARFAAEDSRIAALAARYRAKQVPSSVSFADLFENRRRATVLAKGCNYEESLVRRFAASAAATVMGNSEKNGACVRYADPQTPAEKYMMDCVTRASSARATSGGLYGVMCNDGTVRGAAEAKRVSGLAVQFRNKQKSLLTKEAAKFGIARYAIENYGKMCSYEEDLFIKYPATGAAMRPDSARY